MTHVSGAVALDDYTLVREEGQRRFRTTAAMSASHVESAEVLSVCTVAIWLILPVVICLSQRLSHACLSINAFIVKLQGLITPVIVYLMVSLQGYLW